MKPIDIAHANFVNWRPRVDNSVSLFFETPELNDDEILAVRALRGHNCRILIAPLDSEEKEMIVIDKEAGERHPSQRLRNTLRVLWEKEGKKSEWENFYKERMEKLIDFVKSKIEKAENPLN